MKKQLLLTIAILAMFKLSYAQCIGSNTTGTHNNCFLNTSQQANINRANIDSIVGCNAYLGAPIGIAYGGTGATSLSGALTNLLPSQVGNPNKALFTDGSNLSWGSVGTDSAIYATKYFTNSTYQPKGSYLTSEVDGSISNEIQGLSISTNTISLSNGGGSVVLKLPVSYSGTTNGSGVYSVTFSTAYSVAPNIQASITNQSATNQYVRISSITTTGFTINAYSFNSVNIAGIVALLPTTTNLSGATIDVLITEK